MSKAIPGAIKLGSPGEEPVISSNFIVSPYLLISVLEVNVFRLGKYDYFYLKPTLIVHIVAFESDNTLQLEGRSADRKVKLKQCSF